MDNAKIEQWMKWTTATLQPMCNDVTKGILGNEEILDSAWKRSNNEMKNQVKIINQAVADNNGWLVGKEMTQLISLLQLFSLSLFKLPLMQDGDKKLWCRSVVGLKRFSHCQQS